MNQWPASKTYIRKVSDLVPYARNSRTHTDDQINQVMRSIEEFGWTNPVLVDENNGIIAGHCRVMAAERLGVEKVPVMIAAGWTEAQRKAYVIADNKLAENAGWDMEALKLEMADLEDMDFDLTLTGFDADESRKMLEGEGNEAAEDVPEASATQITKAGDVWVLGDHRIVCGDSTDAETVALCLNGAKPHLMVTDPPYGVNYDADWRNKTFRSDGTAVGGRAVGKVQNDDIADWSEAWALFRGDVAYVWHALLRAKDVIFSLEKTGFDIRAQIIWAKNNIVIGRGAYHVKHEPCYYAVRGGKAAQWNGGRKQNTLWEIPKPQKSETGHSTQKPVECMKRPIENNSKPGDAVYEPFCGSGTTIIAAEITGRHCYAIELDPSYCDIIVKRWQNFTGKRAKHGETGKPFPEKPASE